MIKKFIFSIFFLNSILFAQSEFVVSKIDAKIDEENQITVTWENNSDFDVKIYKSNKIIENKDDLQNCTFENLEKRQNSYTEKILDDSEHFYFVSLNDENLILCGVNSTILGIRAKKTENQNSLQNEIPQKNDSLKNREKRETPLPYIDFSDEYEESFLNNFIKNQNQEKSNHLAQTLKPHIFDEEKTEPEGGEEFLLYEIISNQFVQKNYSEANQRLTRLLGTNISQNVRIRATFYLAQTLYYLENYEQAILTFARVENAYPALVKKWISSSLDKM